MTQVSDHCRAVGRMVEQWQHIRHGWESSKRFCSTSIVCVPWDLYICFYNLLPQNESHFLQSCIAFVVNVVKRVCKAGKLPLIPRVRTCIPLSFGSNISRYLYSSKNLIKLQRLFVWFEVLLPSHVETVNSPNHTFPKAGLTKPFTCYWQQSFLSQWKEKNKCRTYFMINVHKSMELGQDQTQDPWIFSHTRYWMCNGSGYNT